ncbi:MAG: hypothetical protein HY898_35720 [Deltaproteobacteria bacterium]|nr:hypothetical protein [Deltaproteobacteria bacterium]
MDEQPRSDGPAPSGSASAPAPPQPVAGSDTDSWYRRAADDERRRKIERQREVEEANALEAEERRKWVVGVAGGYGAASGSKKFAADALLMSLMVTRYSLELDSPSNTFLAIEVPTRRYVRSDAGETAWGTGMYAVGGFQEWWIVASLGVGGGLVPGINRGGAGARARLGIRLWRFVLSGEAGGICGPSGQGGFACVGDAGGVLSLDVLRMFGARP